MKQFTTFATFAVLAFFLPVSPVVARQDAPTMPVQGGSLMLKVPDFTQARARLFDAASATGAQVTEGQTIVDPKGRKHGYITLRLPSKGLPRLLPAIRAIGVLSSDKITTADASGEYEEIGARIEELRKHQSRLDSLLHSGRNLRGSDILYVQERLFRSGVDEAQLAQSRRNIERRSQVAQVTVTLFEPLPDLKPLPPIRAAQQSLAHGYVNAVKRAEYHRGELLRCIVAALAFAVVYAPLYLPALGASIFIVWRFRATLARALHRFVAFGAALVPKNTPPLPRKADAG